jgi:cell cycle checkpoint protein
VIASTQENTQHSRNGRNIMERHIRRTNVPTVFVFSDVYEGKHKPEDLERLIPSSMLYSLLVQTLQIQAVTKAKMKKCLEAIAKEEGLGRLSTELMEELHLSSGGDLRHAILALQFRFGSGSSTEGRARAVDLDSTKASKRDVKLSTFHALGKLLYAKRKPRSQDPYSTTEKRTGVSAWDDGRGPLDFVPEQVLEKTDMATSSAISFIAYHSPDFFTDIAQLSDAFDSISDAGEFMDRLGQTDGPFPMDYASSLGGRAIADANKNPAPSQFRHLSAPKVFEVMNKKRENETKMKQLRKRLSGSEKIAINDNIGSAHQFVTNSLPFMRNVIPQGERRFCVCLCVCMCVCVVAICQF